jgi:hypothetical protein
MMSTSNRLLNTKDLLLWILIHDPVCVMMIKDTTELPSLFWSNLICLTLSMSECQRIRRIDSDSGIIYWESKSV